MAVIDSVAAAVGGDQQRLIAGAVEQRRQRMCFVVVAEMQRRIGPETAVTAKRREIEQLVNIPGVIATHLML